MPVLTQWSNFFVITGSSAAALTGLMFVVVTLVAGQERLVPNARDGVETFSSPTVVHFCAALLISAVLSAPWHSLFTASIILALTGVYGLAYATRALVRLNRARVRLTYDPEVDDWIWYAIVPVIGYAAVVIAAIAFTRNPAQMLFVLAGCVMLLIFLGIRNAWDTVTYIAVIDNPKVNPSSRSASARSEEAPAFRE